METILDQKKELARSSRHFFSGTLLSRVLGLLRDILMASIFGSHPSIAALMVAFRLSNLMRRLFGEGALHSAFVPAFEKIRKTSEKEGAMFFVDLSFLLGGALFLVTLCSEGFLFFLIKKGGGSNENLEILTLTALILPSLFFICHAAFCSSLLQCRGTYFLPAISPLFFNVCWILGVLFLSRMGVNRAVFFLALFILLGLIMQWLVVFPKTVSFLKKDLKGNFRLSFIGVKKSFLHLGKPLLLGLVGVSATQINNALDSLFARAVDLKGPAYLWFALRIEQVPLALFGVALAGALLPTLSRAYYQDRKNFETLLDFGLARSIAFLIPCVTALFLIGPATINLLFSRGRFDIQTALQTTFCLWGYLPGLLFQGMSLILASAFYAQQKYKVTTSATIFAMGVNIILNTYFAFALKWGSWGIAVATSISAGVQVTFLFFQLFKALPKFQCVELKKGIVWVSLVSFLSGFFTWVVVFKWNPFVGDKQFLLFPREFSKQLFNFGFQTVLFLIFLWLFSTLLKVKGVLELFRFFPFSKIRE